MPRLPARHEIGRQRESSNAFVPHTVAVQRGSELRIGRHLGKHGELGRLKWCALGFDALLGTGASRLQTVRFIRPRPAWRNRGVQAGREEWEAPVNPGLDV